MIRTYRTANLGLIYDLSTDHAASSYAIPVLVDTAGNAQGAGDLTPFGREASLAMVPVVDDEESRTLMAMWSEQVVAAEAHEGIAAAEAYNATMPDAFRDFSLDTKAPAQQWRDDRGEFLGTDVRDLI